MKVLLINGSPKEHGNTFQALSEVADTLNVEGIETEIVSIGKDAIHGCIACGYCGKTGRCTYNDDLYYRIWRAVQDGIDGLVVG
jgi:multimeric flavodoxin WrbA